MNASNRLTTTRSSNWALWAVGLLYSAIVLTCAGRHEAWFDEAQSWLLARDASPSDLFTHYARWEGTPSLWHWLLMPFAKNGFPYVDLSYISAAIAIIGVGIFLWRSPFPLWMRLLFPFTYFPIFQYSVIARSYVLVAPLLFAIAALFRTRTSTRPILYCFILALLANSSFHGTIVAGVLFAEWLFETWRTRTFRSRPAVFAIIVATFGLLYCSIYLELRVPLGLSHSAAGLKALNPGTVRLLKQVSEAFWGGLGNNYYRIFSTLVGISVIAISLWCFGKSASSFILGASTFLLLSLAGLKHAAAWHAGVIFLVWILALWIYFERNLKRSWLLEPVIAIIFIAQVAFGLRSVWFDVFHTYSGSREAAAYLAATREDNRKLYAIGFKAYAVNPYFPRNVYAQQEHGRRNGFYLWESDIEHVNFADLALQRPERIVLSPWDATMASRLKQAGYCEERHFEGSLWWKNAIAEPDTYSILAPCNK